MIYASDVIYGWRRMIYLLCKHDIISVSKYAAGIYHPPKVVIIPKVYHPFAKTDIIEKSALRRFFPGTDVHNDTLANPHEIKVFGSRQIYFTEKI